jgi:hypothetical protein
MTVEQAIKILDPDTSNQAISDLEELNGTDAMDHVVSQIREACEVACKVMRQWLRDMVVEPMGGTE